MSLPEQPTATETADARKLGYPPHQVREYTTWARTHSTTTLHRFQTVALHSDNTITCNGVNWPVAGVTARVETEGERSERGQARLSATRLVLLGPFALAVPKRKTVVTDGRRAYLVISGPGFETVLEVDPDLGLVARQFAAHINTAGHTQPVSA
jgi:hypothetical protein